MIKLSIIIPHYNSPRLLEKLLSSIPNNEDIQVLVVDDKSNKMIDEYERVKKYYSNRNIEFIDNLTNKKGAGVCRNIALDKLNSEWVMFADADDYFINGFYDVVTNYFTSNNDIVFFSPTSIELDTGNIADRHSSYENKINEYSNNKTKKAELMLRYTFYVPWSKLIRSKLIKENRIKFSETLASNDVMFSAYIGHKAQQIEVCKKSIYCVTRSKGSLTTNISDQVFQDRLDIFIEYCNFLKKELKKDDLAYFEIDGIGFILNALIYKKDIKKVIKTITVLKKNKINIISPNSINPISLTNRIFNRYRRHKKNKKYFAE